MEEKEKEASLKIGDIKPIIQIAGFEVVKRIENNEPVTVQTQSQAEAEMLSFIFKQNK